MLAKVLGAQIHQLILGLDVVDADLALLHHFLHEKITQRDVHCVRTVGAVAGDLQRRPVSIYSGTLPKLSSKSSSNIMLEDNTTSFIVRDAATSSASIVNCAVSPCSPTLKLIGALASITMYDDADLPLLEFTPVDIRKGSKSEATLLEGDGEICKTNQVAKKVLGRLYASFRGLGKNPLLQYTFRVFQTCNPRGSLILFLGREHDIREPLKNTRIIVSRPFANFGSPQAFINSQ